MECVVSEREAAENSLEENIVEAPKVLRIELVPHKRETGGVEPSVVREIGIAQLSLPA